MKVLKSIPWRCMAASLCLALSVGCSLQPDIAVTLGDGTVVKPYPESWLKDDANKAVESIEKGNPKAARLSERTDRTVATYPGVAMNGLLFKARCYKGITCKRANEKDDLPYIRVVIDVKNTTTAPIRIERVTLFDKTPIRGSYKKLFVSGNTDGSVILTDNQFYGIENPMAKVSVDNKASPATATAYLDVANDLQPGETWTFSGVFGIYAEGELRRNFQTYLNQERAHPYRVMPHYNSWYDLNINRNDRPWKERMNEQEALATMKAFRKELGDRGVFIDSYLWDDGWDNWDSLWDFHPGFPNGFKKLADEAHKNKGASIGCWMSPCGGYGGSQGARVRYAKSQGIIPQNEGLLRMSKPAYYAAFRDRCIDMIKRYNMNLFKFDRMGVGHDCNGAGKAHAPDMQAIVRLIGEMRAAKPDVFINATVGTWASPFWVFYADSIWRGGNDWEGLGPGPQRERWITYRDNKIHDRFAAPAPLFPLNSIMMHGIIVGKSGPPHVMDRSNTPESTRSFANEVWMSMACGTDLQEYYITPALMHKEWWDILAKGIKWLKANEDTLRDTHWIGGDPEANKTFNIYGYASLGKDKGIVILRNPSSTETQTIKGTLKSWLEISGAAQKVKSVKPVYSTSTEAIATPQTTDAECAITIEPFGVRLFEVNF